jgi:hypothetical protein
MSLSSSPNILKALIARVAWALYCAASGDRRIAGPRDYRPTEWDPRRCEIAVAELRPAERLR